MASKRPLGNRPLKLHEIIEELECLDDDDLLPSAVGILPPENANAEVTDEDSGNEEAVTWHNLPGYQLRAPADLIYSDDETFDSEDEQPLSSLAKKRCASQDVGSFETIEQNQDNSENVINNSIPVIVPSVPINQKYQWRNHHNPTEFQPWQEVQGPKKLQSPLHYFDCMFDENVIKLLVSFTNMYASKKNKVGNVTTDEMKCFLGILLFSGYVQVPRRSLYWEKSTDTDFCIVNEAMSRDRFDFIMANIHRCDNSMIQVSADKFAKLRPLFDENFLAFAPFEENYSIDEAMVPYFGRAGLGLDLGCKQFIRGKPIRWGYKFWVGATRLGYVLWFDPYQGKSSKSPHEYKQFGLGGSVILQFADVLQNHKPGTVFHLFFDNFFTSIPLLHELTNRGLRATGTIRENRTSSCPLPTKKDMQKKREVRTSRSLVTQELSWSANGITIVWFQLQRIVKRYNQYAVSSVFLSSRKSMYKSSNQT